MSKIVFIHRQLTFSQMSHTDSDVLDWFNQSFKALTPYWKGKIVGTGLTTSEQRLLMPYLHGVEAEDKEFRKRTELYFNEILTRVPPIGLKLEIGLEDDSLPVSIDNMPLNIQDFVVFRHAIGHPAVAMSQVEASRNPIKHFYVVDPAQVQNTGLELNKLEDSALTAYFKYKDDEVKIDQILTLLGINIKKMTFNEKVIAFKKVASKTDGKNEIIQKQELQKFIDLCEDQDLMIKYLIQEMVGAQVLERSGTTIFVKESGDAIGASLKEAVAFLKNPKNSRTYNMLRAQYENLVRKGQKLPEPVEAEIPVSVDPAPETGRKKVKPEVD